MAELYCETCGEVEQEIHLAEVGLCRDCFAKEFRAQMRGFFWAEPCGQPVYEAGQLIRVCVEPYGSEHDHGRFI